jgi:hypothetical protein
VDDLTQPSKAIAAASSGIRHPEGRRVAESFEDTCAPLPSLQHHPSLVLILIPVPGAVRPPEAAAVAQSLSSGTRSSAVAAYSNGGKVKSYGALTRLSQQPQGVTELTENLNHYLQR